MHRKHSKKRYTRAGAPAKKVARTVLAGTIGLSMLQAPIWAESFTQSGSSYGSTTGASKTQSAGDKAAADHAAEDKAKISKEEAAKKMIALFPILEQAKLAGSSYNENDDSMGNESVWTLNWSITKGNSTFGFDTSVDAITGDVLNFYQPYNLSYEDKAYYPPEITREQAEKAAKDFIAKAASSTKAGDLVSQDVLYRSQNSLFGPVMYNFSYNLKVNGIPSDGETINVTVDGKGRIFSYSRTTSAKKYPSAKPAISFPDAVASFKKDLSLTLAYVPFNEMYNPSNAKKDWRLEYIPTPYLTTMDANTGKRVSPLQTPETKVPKTLEYTALPSSAAVFTARQGKTLTSKEVVQLFSDLVPVGKDYALNSSLSKYWMNTGKQVWNLYWNSRNLSGVPGDSVSMMVDADNGQLINYDITQFSEFAKHGGSEQVKADSNAKKEEPAISEAKAKEKAIEFVLRHYPDASKVLKLSNESRVDVSEGKTRYIFVFQQFYKDLPIYNHQVNVVLDGSGKLLSYNTNPSLSAGYEKELDALSAQIKPEDALRTYQEALGAELRYSSSGGFYTSSRYMEPTITLSYVPTFKGSTSLQFLNAVTGKSEIYGFPYASELGAAANLPADASAHAASKELAVLLEYNVIAPDNAGLLHPDAELTYGDLLIMISKAVSPDQSYSDTDRIGKQFKDVSAESPYAQAALFFADRGWFSNAKSDELRPEQKLTREKLAETIVDILHYDRIAKLSEADPKVMSLSDAAAIQNKGAVELVMKLGLMTAKDGKFEPAKTVTKAEAAQVLVLLAQSQGKVDTPISG
ncbi:YcdB/YcdC domain-containing protein [Paenibacillus azoreducens]|uniref:SLH domain-containing protein n=1 Tax=Paenibacillus azoreducens TaxID=116718 RepID=A0A920CN77_9BACL|nr:YcdB/YcdC domain-containing protein [Paenibacillus azoreducens]GIO47156.1 hypothetical protein J34TS1_19210 [Paenibacillus azoreducens]